jgi:4-hydroxy-3-methylbut-2-enyl diphosphate reductase
LRKFVSSHDVIIFASDSKSSNGKYLFGICKAENSKSYFVHDEASLQKEWFQGAASVGITGATSTPLWLMEAIQTKIPELFTSEKQAK